MNLWTVDRIMNRLNTMLDHAISGDKIEDVADETKMSALETKLAKYLAMNQLGKEELQKERERIGELLSDISHQTKTPIANLLLYSELLEETTIDDKSRDLVKAMHEQAEKLSFLIQAMVKASRLESGVIQTIPKENSIQKMFDAIILQSEGKATAKNIVIKVQPTECKALFDQKWTTEAVFNILDNAIKYTYENGQIEISAREYSLFTRIDIKDNGIGIAESEIPKVFGRFYKGSATQQEEGVGLGLYLAREIISGQGGYIKVESKEGMGSTFSIFLRTPQ